MAEDISASTERIVTSPSKEIRPTTKLEKINSAQGRFILSMLAAAAGLFSQGEVNPNIIPGIGASSRIEVVNPVTRDVTTIGIAAATKEEALNAGLEDYWQNINERIYSIEALRFYRAEVGPGVVYFFSAPLNKKGEAPKRMIAFFGGAGIK